MMPSDCEPVFVTILLGPQLQALWRDPKHAKETQYLREETQQICEQLHINGGVIDLYDDFCKGSDYLEAVKWGDIKPDDIVLMILLDSTQLYESKESDCWIYIWIVMNHAPDKRYKKHYILLGGFIPGPNKPKNINSFLFPGLHHLATLQNECLRIWDASQNITFLSDLYLIFVTANGPGLVYFNGMVGHSGHNGCCLYCGLLGCCKGNHYYPALLLPNNYNMEGSNHPDHSPYDIQDPSSSKYFENLCLLVTTHNTMQYKKLRMETGITKPAILLGLDVSCMLSIPDCLTPDIMHLAALLSDLFLSLWHGTIDCTPPDHLSQWPWAIFRCSDAWELHGALISSTAQHLPCSFDRKPCNPTEKISSGYKTWEFQLYMFSITPALLHGILPEAYWHNFCKLVQGFQLICQTHITHSELCDAHILLTEWPLNYEELYCQRSAARLHFVGWAAAALSQAQITQNSVVEINIIWYVEEMSDSKGVAFHSLISVLKLPDDTDPLTFSLTDVITQGSPTLDKHTLKEKHPAIHFWTKVDYDAFTLSPESQGLNRGKAPWLELENGDPLTSQQLSAVQTTLHSAWAELVQCKLAPPTWTKVSTSGKELVYKIMVKKHPLFALDNDGFKLEMLCVTDYPKWCKNHLTPTGEWKDASSSKAPLKEESEEASDGTVISPLDLKGKKCENDDGGGMCHDRAFVISPYTLRTLLHRSFTHSAPTPPNFCWL
ncbi:hypothetical protein M404DRAFT_28315 [Pisolithus tinctorius Marx 270]|uniref:Uncharacterized protein n=1 Tax=Pisolithus tinctorius Marx 270 TaxID=870435 RepID=A0A0C3IYD5_PISTI|nr:hypothetical protein M404DRAFT_28315 [Pisolithus tinctorius Marx 270]